MKSVREIADEYFQQLNSITSRLCADINETKASYDKLWATLPEDEQNQILNESIIKPEARLKYKHVNEDTEEVEFATKMVVDDNYMYRDEHSAPFSFRTASQRDLTIFGNYKDVALKLKMPRQLARCSDTSSIIQKEESSDSCNNYEYSTDTTSVSTILPKTGLDFLDNW